MRNAEVRAFSVCGREVDVHLLAAAYPVLRLKHAEYADPLAIEESNCRNVPQNLHHERRNDLFDVRRLMGRAIRKRPEPLQRMGGCVMPRATYFICCSPI